MLIWKTGFALQSGGEDVDLKDRLCIVIERGGCQSGGLALRRDWEGRMTSGAL